MKFKKIKKRKYYQTWQHKNRKTGLLSLIYCNPSGYYHWVVCCFIKRCGRQVCVKSKEDCVQSVHYNSLDKELVYESFKECIEAIVTWHRLKGF